MAATSNDLNESIERNFLQFLLKFKKSFMEDVSTGGEPFYISKVKEMKMNGLRNLLVDFKHIAELNAEDLDFDPLDFEMVIQQHYLRVQSALLKAVSTFVRSINPEVTEWVSSSPHPLGLGFYNLGDSHGLRSLRTAKLGELQAIGGTVTRTSEVKPELMVAVFDCPDCGREISGTAVQVHRAADLFEPAVPQQERFYFEASELGFCRLAESASPRERRRHSSRIHASIHRCDYSWRTVRPR